MDSLVTFLDMPNLIAKNTAELYFLARVSQRLYPLITNSRTYEQLQNSGNFRLIRNLGTSNKIMNYYEKFPLISLLESINESEFTEYKKCASKVFEPSIFLQMEKDNGDVERIP